MAVVKEGLFFVSEKYAKSLPEKGPDGEKLVLGENAFVSLEDAVEKNNNNSIVFLDKKLEIDRGLMTDVDVWAAYDYDIKDEVYNLKAVGKLDISGSKSELKGSNFHYFKDVTVSDRAVLKYVNGGNNSRTVKKNVTTETLAASGKITVEKAEVYDSYGMDTVVVDDSDSGNGRFYRGFCDDGGDDIAVGTNKVTVKDETVTKEFAAKKGGKFTGKNSAIISVNGYNTVALEKTTANDLTNKTLTKTVEKSVDGESVSYQLQDTASGSVTLKKNSAVEYIEGYQNVTLDESTGGFIYAFNAGVVDWVTNETFNDKLTVDDNGKAKGSISNVINVKSAGTVKLTGGSEAKNIMGYTTVSLTEESSAANVERALTKTDNASVSFKTNKDDTVTATYSQTVTNAQNGSFSINTGYVGTFEEDGEGGSVFNGGLISNYSSVKITNASVGDITLNTDFKSTLKGAYEYGSADELSHILENYRADVESSEESTSTSEIKAAGSVTVKLDKKADKDASYSTGNISGYNSVTVTGTYDKKKDESQLVSVGSVSAAYFMASTDYTGYEGYAGTSKTEFKKGVWSVTVKAAGAAKFTDAVVNGAVNGYGTVALTRATVSDNIVNGVNVTLKGEKEKFSISGSFTATDSTVLGAVYGYKTVKLTDSMSGNICIVSDYSGGGFSALGASATLSSSTANLIGGYKTVTMTDSSAMEIDGGAIKGTALNLTGSSAGTVNGVQTVNIKKGYNAAESYLGTEFDDKVTISKGAVLQTGAISNETEGKDKLIINGTLVLTGDTVGSGFILSGKGEIAAAGSIWSDEASFEGFKGKLLDTGDTAVYFSGTAAEMADNTEKKAVSWKADGAGDTFNGWLGSWTEIGEESPSGTDEVDYIKLKVAEDCVLKWEGDVLIDDFKQGDTLEAGTNYVLKITQQEGSESSVSYSLSLSDVI